MTLSVFADADQDVARDQWVQEASLDGAAPGDQRVGPAPPHGRLQRHVQGPQGESAVAALADDGEHEGIFRVRHARVIGADQVSQRLQNEFYERSKHPLDTPVQP